jgi:hypothetical protein
VIDAGRVVHTGDAAALLADPERVQRLLGVASSVEPVETPSVEPVETPSVEPVETPSVETPSVEPVETPVRRAQSRRRATGNRPGGSRTLPAWHEPRPGPTSPRLRRDVRTPPRTPSGERPSGRLGP